MSKNLDNFSFNKFEKIKSRKAISQLFTSGKFIFVGNLKAVWLNYELEENSTINLKTAISVPKKKIRLAVNRNLIKRRISEAFRKNKHIITNLIPKNIQLQHMIIYNTSKILPYSEIEVNVINYLNKVVQKTLEKPNKTI